jgi:hypothetical protein
MDRSTAGSHILAELIALSVAKNSLGNTKRDILTTNRTYTISLKILRIVLNEKPDHVCIPVSTRAIASHQQKRRFL